MLPSGPDGFITGKASESLDKIASEIAVLKAIHSDTTATLTQLTSIARSLERGSVVAPKAPPEAQRSPVVRTRGQGSTTQPAAPREYSPKSSGPAPAPRSRESNGQFVGQGSPSSPGRASAAISGAGESLRAGAGAVVHGADGIDPTVQAAKEIGGIFSPLGAMLKPMGRMFGRRTPEQKNQRENVAWYRRIWGAVKNPSGGSGGMGLIMTALLSMLGMLLAPIKALGRLLGMGSLAKMLGGVASGMGGGRGSRKSRGQGSTAPAVADGKRRTGPGGSSPEVGAKTKTADAAGSAAKAAKKGSKGIAGKGLDLKSLLGKGASLGKSLLKGIPFFGALIGGGMLASSVMAADDPNLSPQENKTNRYSDIGGGIGSLVGGVLGMLGGPVGAIAGGLIGDQLGSMVGSWLSTVDLASVPGKISDAFNGLKDGALLAATSAFDAVKDLWGGMVATGTKLLSGMTDSVKEVWSKAVDSMLNLKDTVADKVQSAQDYVGDKATSVKDAGQNLLSKVTGGSYTGGSNARKDELIKAMDSGGITDPKSKAMLMANVDHESGGFKKNEENLNYSAKRLQEVFPKYYSTPEAARADAGNPEAIANKVYGGRMGNTEAGDGYKYRGRGNIQLTGKAQYEEMGKKLGVDLVNNPDLAMDPKYSAQIAVQHWKSSGADKAAMAGDQDRARKLTNGGTNGLEDVKSKYDGYLAQAKAGDLTPTRRADEGKVQGPEGANAAVASTMSTIKGAPAVGVMPLAPRASVAPGGVGAGTVGIMAPSVSAPAIGLAGTKPVSAGSMVAPSYSPPAPDASMVKIAPTPAVEKPLVSPSKPAAQAPAQMMPLSQNVEDRQIAHVSAGGMGMGGG